MSSSVAPAQAPEFETSLWQAGELLRSGNAQGAAEALGSALALRPRDPKARSLLALVAFKQGRLDEAAALYQELLAEHPSDAAIAMYLGLVQLKLGHAEKAVASLERALERDPGSERVKQYLALARRVQGGQAAPAQAPPEPMPATPATPAAPAAPTAPVLSRPQSIARFATDRLIRAEPDAEAFALTAAGVLSIEVRGELHTRTDGLLCSVGDLAFEPSKQRVRGRAVDQRLGEEESPVFVVRGQGRLLIEPRSYRFFLLSLDEDILYVRQGAVFAFESSLGWENGRAPGGEPELVQFRGSGCVALRCTKEPFCVRLDAGQMLFAEAASLLGWIGRVIPRAVPAQADVPRFLECSGDGVLVYG